MRGRSWRAALVAALLGVVATHEAVATHEVAAQQRDAGVDAAAVDAAPVPETDAGAAPTELEMTITEDGSLEPIPPGVGPIVWADPGPRCRGSGRERHCEGPRRVPRPSEEALARQQELGLGERRVAHRATVSTPPPEWAAAVPTPTPIDMQWPVQGGRLWRGFGLHQRLRSVRGRMRPARGRRVHQGVDIGAQPGTPILAVNDGLVVYSDNGMTGYGNVVILVHQDGTVTLYAHCRATYVAAGELVQRGQVIASVGDTGLAHGPHLHFEWRVGGAPRDPLRHFVGRPGREPAPAPASEEASP